MGPASPECERGHRHGARVFDGTVYVSTVPGNTKSFYKGNGAGVLWALDAESGESKWKFWTVPENLWSTAHKDINSGGGLWHPPGFDDDGDVYIAVANPAPWPGSNELPWGSSRPGPNPHSNSIVKLNREDGEMIWARQVLPHDVYDWDLQLPPIVTQDGDRDLILASGKLGYVYAIDAGDGSIVWKKAVGKHNGHDQDNEPALAGQYEQMPKLPITILPGILGGVETQMAVADGVVYAPIVNVPTRLQDAGRLRAPTPQGDWRDGRAERGRRLGQVEARPCTTGVRRRDSLE